MVRFELTTSVLSGQHSNQLSYIPLGLGERSFRICPFHFTFRKLSLQPLSSYTQLRFERKTLNGNNRTRTDNTLFFKQVLYHLELCSLMCPFVAAGGLPRDNLTRVINSSAQRTGTQPDAIKEDYSSTTEQWWAVQGQPRGDQFLGPASWDLS